MKTAETQLSSLLHKDLVEWVEHNEKLNNKISPSNLINLFTFDGETFLLIDLTRFNDDYYEDVFTNSSNDMVGLFIGKVCFVIKQSLFKAKKYELIIAISVRYDESTISPFQNYYIHPKYSGSTYAKEPITGNMNIFQIWDIIGRKTPFVVKRSHWSDKSAVFVENVECDKLPYGKAYGYLTANGQYSDGFKTDKRWREHRMIPNAGVYGWILVNTVNHSE